MRAGRRRTVLPGAASGGGGQGAAACSSASLAPASCSHRAAVSHSGQCSGGDQIRMGPRAPPNGPVGRCSRSTRLKLSCRHALPAAGPIPVQLLAVVGATGRSPRASVLPVGPCVQRLGVAADCVALARPAWLSGVGRRRGTLRRGCVGADAVKPNAHTLAWAALSGVSACVLTHSASFLCVHHFGLAAQGVRLRRSGWRCCLGGWRLQHRAWRLGRTG